MSARVHRTGPRVWPLAMLMFGIMAAHAMLETARDALFLTHLGPGRLASAYLAIAVLALLAVAAMRRWSGTKTPRRTLIGFLAWAAGGTAALAMTISNAPGVVFVLYLWTGLVATLVVPSLWTLIDRVLRIGDAKRLFAVIAAGGVLGALVGSGGAAALSLLVGARHLISIAAGIFALTAAAAILVAPDGTSLPSMRRLGRRARPKLGGETKRYVRLLLVVGLLSTITLTLGDLMFKRIVAERMADHDLATVFGAIYAGLNLLGLAIQLLVTPRLLDRLGVGGALTVLPLVVIATMLGFVLTGAAIALIALKLGDGGLRHSVHRVASEILFLPIGETSRDAARPVIDAIGQRGGQAAAALLALALVGQTTCVVAVAILIVAVAWLIAIAITRRAYVQRFRDTLDAGIQRDVRIPSLDGDSIALLTGALASPDENEALAALDLLSRRGDEVPVLVLYHPSTLVVRRALSLLQNTRVSRGRTATHAADVARVLGHLTSHSDPEIRAAALAASSRTGNHRARLLCALRDPEPEVRAAAVVGLFDDPLEPAVETTLAAMLDGTTADRVALAHAIQRSPLPRFRTLLDRLTARDETAVTREVLRAWAMAPELSDPDRLLQLLENPHVRGDVRRVFAVATHHYERLIAALDDARTPIPVRRHLPRTISRFGTPAAAGALVDRLLREPDGTTEFKILRALGRMRVENPSLRLDLEPVLEYARRSVADAARYGSLEAGLASDDTAFGTSVILLSELLGEKRRNAIERVFRALGIVYPRGELRSVHEGITSDDEERIGAAREVLEALVPAAIRQPLVAVLDGDPVAHGTYESTIAALLADPSESLRAIAAHHVAERHLVALRPHLTRLRPTELLVTHAFDQAIASLDV